MKTVLNKENVERVLPLCKTRLEILKKLGLNSSSSSYKKLNTLFIVYKMDISGLLTHSEVMKRTSSLWRKKTETSELLVENSNYKSTYIKERLYKEGLKKRKCELCGQGEIWCGKKISLILDHKNGDRTDNRFENLRIVCPNCDATLDTFCRGKRRRVIKTKKKYVITGSRKTVLIRQRKVERPDYLTLKEEVKKNGFSSTGRKYGVSDVAIRKWIRNYEKNKF